MTPRPLPATWYGVTLDDVSDLAAVRASLAALPRMPVVRVVFDRGMQASTYTEAIGAIRSVAYVLGQPVDSSDVAVYSVRAYGQRFREYLTTLGRRTDVWEVGNEVNGEWLGSTEDVVAKISRAYDEVRAAGGRTALTLYFNPGCAAKPSHEMLAWAERNLPSRVRRGLDYALVSYYEHDCRGYRPSAAEWSSVFHRLHRIFPRSRLGFGEVGAAPGDALANKQRYLEHYYRLSIPVPGYVGGYFWWSYAEEMLPHTGNPLWRTLANTIASTDSS